MEHHSHPGAMLVAFGAAGLGLAARSLETVHPLFGAAAHWPSTPDELYAWAKAVANSAFVLVNAGVGCWHLVTMGRSTIRRTASQRRRKDTPSPDPAPHTDSSDGAPGKPA
jgi:hypothetical protein